MSGGELHQYGEEFVQRRAMRSEDLNTTEIKVGLYLDDENEGGDNLQDSDNVNDINTEPDDGNYTRNTVQLDTNDITLDVSGEDAVVIIDPQEFDVENTTGDIDAYFIIVNYESEFAGDTEPSDNLFGHGLIDTGEEPQSLDNLNAYEVQNMRLRLS